MQVSLNKNSVYIIPLGGCGEIGLNLTLIGNKNFWVAIDCGTMFPQAQNLGIDCIIPSLDWLKSAGIKIAAWLFTHAHEDHIGALPWILKEHRAPIYGSRLTNYFIEEKLAEAHIEHAEIHEVIPGKPFQIGTISCIGVHMEHSIPDGLGYVIQTSSGNIFSSGDFRFSSDSTWDLPYPIKVLLADSTNALVSGKDRAEEELIQEFTNLFHTTKGRVVVISFASSLWRIKTVLQAAKCAKRRIFLLGKSLSRNVEFAKKSGIFTEEETKLIIEESELSKYNHKEICVIAAGSQGEIYSGAFRLANKHVSQIQLEKKDAVVFSSRTIPGNEKAVNSLLNSFARLGVCILATDLKKYHVSGHGFEEDLKNIIIKISPEYFIPIHGEFRHLERHRQIALECGMDEKNSMLVEDGMVIELTPEEVNKTKLVVPADKKYICNGICSEIKIPKSRAQVARSGILFITVLIESSEFKPSTRYSISFKDHGIAIDNDQLSTIINLCIEKQLSSHSKVTEESLKQGVKRAIAQKFASYKPVIEVQIISLVS